MATKQKSYSDKEKSQIRIIANNIKRLIAEANITQAELGKILGISESAVGKWILGHNAPSMGNIQKIADHFNILKSELLEDHILRKEGYSLENTDNSLGNKEVMAQNIKRLMHNAQINATELAKAIKVPYTTVLSWVNAANYPRIDKIEIMANYFGVNKTNLVEPFRRVAFNPEIQKTVKSMRKLNAKGQQKVADYAEDLTHTELYALEFDEEPVAEEVYTIGAAAAGPGYAYGDPDEHSRLFMTTELPEHDFAIDVKGDSMFPTIVNGDVAFIKKDCDHIDGRIYVLDIDGETVIKRLFFKPNQVTLRSDNEAYEDRILEGAELDASRMLGLVVGWETPTA